MAIRVSRVEPIYGYGWSLPSGDAREVPTPFDLALGENGDLKGIVLDADHEFSGASVHLSPRHADATGMFNVTVNRTGSSIALGFAKIDLPTNAFGS
jgi:hypothetical protein